MPARTPSIISALLTALSLIVFSIFFLFMEVIALNGASERQGSIALTVSLVCQGVSSILAAVLASWLTKFLITKFNWNAVLAVIVAVIASVMMGIGLSLLAIFISILAAGIR